MNIDQPEYFLGSPPTLKTLASQELALVLCWHTAPYIDVDRTDGLNNFAYTLNGLAPRFEGVPTFVGKLVKNCLYSPVAISFGDWCNYHENYVFYDVPLQYYHYTALKCMDEFVLKPDGEINFVQTAKNLLKTNKLTTVEKYKFACINCLVDDIERLWPLVSNNSKLTDESQLEKSPMIGYWTDVMRGKFERLSPQNSDLISNKWGRRILSHVKYPAIEYFWNFLSDDEKIAVAKIMLDEDEALDSNIFHYEARGTAIQFYPLFLNLSDERLRMLLDRVHVEQSFLNPFCSSGADRSGEKLQAWNRLKHLISPAEFASVVKGFVEKGFKPLIPAKLTYVEEELVEIWTSAPSHFRNHVLNDLQLLKDIFKSLDPNIRAPFVLDVGMFHDFFFDMKFFLVLLPEVRFQWRNLLWRDFWTYVIFHANLPALQNMMRLCLGNEDEIARFKENEMMQLNYIEDFCKVLVINGRFAVLAEYLDFCTPKKKRVEMVKRRILQDDSLRSDIVRNVGTYRGEKFASFENFIASAFPDKKDGKKYVRKFMKSFKKYE